MKRLLVLLLLAGCVEDADPLVEWTVTCQMVCDGREKTTIDTACERVSFDVENGVADAEAVCEWTPGCVCTCTVTTESEPCE